MANRESTQRAVRELLNAETLAVLSTQHEGRPYASLVGFAASDNLRTLVFATMRTTRKFSYLTAAPHVALLVDNRSKDPGDFHHAMAVTATGSAAEASPDEYETLLQGYLSKLPHLDEFVRSPNCALVTVAVDTYYVVSRFQNVVELHFEL